MPRVVIIGGSFAGRRCKKVLSADPSLSVALVDQFPWAEYTPSILRCLVEPSTIDSYLIPHSSPGFVHAFAEGVELREDGSGGIVRLLGPDGVRRDLEFDYLIIATGSLYSLLKPSAFDTALKRLSTSLSLLERKQQLQSTGREIKAASSIAVVGGGTVGVELAAEIAGHFKSSKKVTLISSKSLLLDRLPRKAGEHAAQWLKKHSVGVVLDSKVVSNTEGEGGTSILRLSSGGQIEADLVFYCIGNGLLPGDSLLPSKERSNEDARSGIRVNEHYQVEGMRTVFAVGDAVAGLMEKTAFSADISANIAAENIIRLHRSDAYSSLLKTNEEDQPSIACVSLYKWDGALQMNGLVLTGFLAAFTKVFIEFMQLCAMKSSIAAAIWLVLENLTTFTATFIPKKHSTT
jgi:NADH dehydrogenase FAD-containing subunit